jgi:hypothetical protein
MTLGSCIQRFIIPSPCCLAQVVRALRTKHNPMQLPIIAIGGRSGEEELVQSLEAGANDFYVKPLSRVELVARIDAQVCIVIVVIVHPEHTAPVGNPTSACAEASDFNMLVCVHGTRPCDSTAQFSTARHGGQPLQVE